MKAYPTETAAEKLLMLSSRSVCQLVENHFTLRQSGAGEIDVAALVGLSNVLGRIAHKEERKRM